MPVYCPVPYYSLEINQQDRGHFCCKMDQRQRSDTALSEFASVSVSQLRDQLMTSRSDLCRACDPQPHQPSHLDSSRRLRKIAQYQQLGWEVNDPQPQLRDLHMALDNVCASSCIACSPNLSSTIDLMTRDQGQQQRMTWFARAGQLRPRAYKSLDLKALRDSFESLELVQIYGGEPLISPLWPEWIATAQQLPKLKFMSLTTGMKQIKARWFDLLCSLPDRIELELVVSMDAALDMNHWIRGCTEQEFMESWSMIDAARSRFKHVIIQPVIANYNVWALPELVAAIDQLMGTDQAIGSSPVWAPTELHAGQLPPELKVAAINKIKQADDATPNQRWWVKRMYKTALNLLRQPQTVDWKQCQKRINLLPNLRGDARTIDHWLDQYLNVSKL